MKLPYLSYLLRLWPFRSDAEVVWRISLEDPRTGLRQGFTGVSELVAFLKGTMDVAAREQTPSKTDDPSNGSSSARDGA